MPQLIEQLRMPDAAITAAQQYQQEHQSRVIRELEWHASVDVTIAGGVAVPTTDAAAKIFGSRIEVVQNEEPIIAVSPIDLRHISACLLGSYQRNTEQTAVAVNVINESVIRLPLDALVPGTMIDGRQTKVLVRGKFGTAAEYGTNTTINGGTVRTSMRAANSTSSQGYLRPAWSQAERAIETAQQDLQFSKRFEKLQRLPGVFLRTFDSSGDAAAAARVNGLLRRITIEHSSPDRTRQIYSATWGEALNDTKTRFGIPLGEQKDGFVFLPLDYHDEETDRVVPLTVGPGHSLMFHFDTISSVEEQFTPITPAANDLVVLTFPASDVIPTASGVQALQRRVSRGRGARGLRTT